MNFLRSLIFGAVVSIASAGSALAQCGTTAPGNSFCGNNAGAPGLAGWHLITPGSLTPIAGGTVLANPTGASAVPSATTAPVLGIPGTSTGQVGLAGSSSGTSILRAQAAAGSAVSLLPTSAGTLAGTASAPLAINAVTGLATCATCATTTSGGALSAVAPITLSAGGAIGVTGSALTKVDDTNVTVTLGGTPASALLAGTSITMGWTGQLAVSRGGTGRSQLATQQSITGATTGYLSTQNGTYINRSNAGAAMLDSVPGSGVFPAGTLVWVKNSDASALLSVSVSAGGATLDGSASGYVLLGPGQSTGIYADGTNYRSIDAPIRAKVPAGVASTIFMTPSSSATGPCLTQATACTPQTAVDVMYQRIDVGASQMIIQAYNASLPATFTTGFVMRGKPPGLGNSSASNPFYHSILVLGDATTPSNYTISNAAGNCAWAIQGSFHIKGFTLSGCAGDGINASSESTVGLESIAFGAITGNDIRADDSSIHWDSNLTKTGAADCHMLAQNGGIIRANSGGLVDAITAGVWGTGNYCVQSGGNIANLSTTQTGTATGPKFSAGPFEGAFAIGTLTTDPNTLLKGSTNGVYSNTGLANNVAGPGFFTSVNVSGLGTNSFVKTDGSSGLASYPTCNSGVVVTDGSGAPSCNTTLPAVNGSAVTNLNASSLATGTVAAARGGAGTITGALKGSGAGVVSQAASTDLSDTTAATTWVPTDQSGASLSLTNGGSNWSKINKTCFGNFHITYPSTANGNSASVSLPCTIANNGNQAIGSCQTSASGANGFLSLNAAANTAVASFSQTTGLVAPTNANLSTAILECFFMFITP